MIPLLLFLLFLSICDYITGLLHGWITKTLKSQVGYIGIIKKTVVFILIFICIVIEYLLFEYQIIDNLTYTFTKTIVLWFIVNELLSIYENLQSFGVRTPKVLDDIVSKLNDWRDKND